MVRPGEGAENGGGSFRSGSLAPRLLLAGWLLAFGGCDKVARQQQLRSQEKAQQSAERGKFPETIAHYEAALDGTVATAEVHYKMALIHDDQLHDPIGAMHHYRRYLELDPEGKWARDARSFLKEDQLKAITSLATGPILTSRDATQLRNRNLNLTQQVTELQAKVKTLRERSIAHPAKRVAGEDKTPSHARYYTVEPGDTLAAIARKFYHSSSRWKDLQDANYHQLEGGVSLKPGMKLIIPK